MATQRPSQAREDHFDESTDNATHAVIAEFEWIGMPDGDQLSDIMVEINNAITDILARYLR